MLKLIITTKLTFKQRVFVKAYLDSFGNSTRAARIAYKCKDNNIAGVTGYRLLRNVNVKNEIDRILALAGVNEESIAQQLRPYILGGSIGSIKLACKLRGYIS